MTSIQANTNVLYCSSRNPYDTPPLRMTDAFKSQEEAFPDICIGSHWDPTELSRRFILPAGEAGPLPTSFLPFTRICTNYVTADRGSGLSGDGVVSTEILLGGKAGRDMNRSTYISAIDAESDLKGLPRRLMGKCGGYSPSDPANLTKQMELACPESKVMTVQEARILGEVNRPKVTIRTSNEKCRDVEDKRNSVVSQRMFNNPTKYDLKQKAINAAKEDGVGTRQKLDGYTTRYS
jgi:hypothetical protein